MSLRFVRFPYLILTVQELEEFDQRKVSISRCLKTPRDILLDLDNRLDRHLIGLQHTLGIDRLRVWLGDLFIGAVDAILHALPRSRRKRKQPFGIRYRGNRSVTIPAPGADIAQNLAPDGAALRRSVFIHAKELSA